MGGFGSKLSSCMFSILYFIYLVVVFGVAFFSWPRYFVLVVSGFFLSGFCFLSLEDKVRLFIRLIPFFVALPLSAHFDSLNLWRLSSIIIFLQWFWLVREDFYFHWRKILVNFRSEIAYLWKLYRVEFLWGAIIFISILSILKAAYPLISLRRVIYFLNLSLIYFPVRYLVKKKGKDILFSFRKDFIWAAGLVILVGVFQLITSYFLSLDSFMKFWAAKVQLSFYGSHWSYIVRRLNTWFAYNFGSSLRLRMFSTFPDSHTFPLFLVISSAWIIWPVFRKKYCEEANKISGLFRRIKKTLEMKIDWWTGINFVLLFISFIEIVLSGTRGIWLGLGIVYFILFFRWVKLRKQEVKERFYLEFSGILLIIFVLAFAYAYLFLSFPQLTTVGNFSFSQGEGLIKRVGSILNLSETSNSGRIFIWQETIKSIVRNPFLGIGIFNFPVILRENISLTKAGATAHNLYLHIAAEIGLIGLLISGWLIYLILKRLRFLILLKDRELSSLFFLLFFSLIWILGYSLTDAAILDERIFLELMILAGIVGGMSYINKVKNQISKVKNENQKSKRILNSKSRT